MPATGWTSMTWYTKPSPVTSSTTALMASQKTCKVSPLEKGASLPRRGALIVLKRSVTPPARVGDEQRLSEFLDAEGTDNTVLRLVGDDPVQEVASSLHIDPLRAGDHVILVEEGGISSPPGFRAQVNPAWSDRSPGRTECIRSAGRRW